MYADAPDAFSEALAEAQAMTAQDWRQRAERYAAGPDAAAFVAMIDDTACGFIAGFVGRWRDGAMRFDDPDTVTVAKAWVDPARRGQGVGRVLADAVVSWAQQKQVKGLEIEVTENNRPAATFYRSLGFVDTGRREPLLSNPTLQIHFLSRSVP
jgi:ribosomal protein S18 acetylase RimI-like enzyme